MATIHLDQWATILIDGYAKEGHPEWGCADNAPCNNVEEQDKEEFKVFVDQEEIGHYIDQGPLRNAWLPSGLWQTRGAYAPGDHQITVQHFYVESPDMKAQSVDYKLSVCAEPAAEPTATETSHP
ncbi:MAG: hypothetical protein HGA45_13300 [Chloroflexales bacterium]|nr:hypothetical protein [Chloroflexales bacterium]